MAENNQSHLDHQTDSSTLHTASAASAGDVAKPAYVPPQITSLTETDILQALGPAYTGSPNSPANNPFGLDGMGGM
ncbi:MAG: hypothetical protein H6644_18485 [Caldilineaceae bacterium]|nr:hypothetical protein [Caldilineaceae bacterium]